MFALNCCTYWFIFLKNVGVGVQIFHFLFITCPQISLKNRGNLRILSLTFYLFILPSPLCRAEPLDIFKVPVMTDKHSVYLYHIQALWLSLLTSMFTSIDVRPQT